MSLGKILEFREKILEFSKNRSKKPVFVVENNGTMDVNGIAGFQGLKRSLASVSVSKNREIGYNFSSRSRLGLEKLSYRILGLVSVSKF